MYKFIVLLCAVTFVAGNTQVSRCQRHSGNLPQSTRIEGCTRPPCQLPQLRDAVIHIEFRPVNRAQSMRTLATAYVRAGNNELTVPYDLGRNSQTCNFLTNTRCPVNAGQLVRYTLRMRIESFFPVGTQANIEFRVVDERNNPQFCLRVPITITAPRSLN